VIGIPLLGAFAGWLRCVSMPGASHAGPLPPESPAQAALRERLASRLEALHRIGPRGHHAPGSLPRTEALLRSALEGSGYAVEAQPVVAEGRTAHNLEAVLAGGARAAEHLVVGAHFDTDAGCPGANDNGTGVASLLELAAAFRARPRPARTIRWVLFTNEEPPWFATPHMGSAHHARLCRERGLAVAGMISLETMGFYSDAEGSQKYPFPFALFYPSRGDFITFVGNAASRSLVRESVASFRRHARFPSEGAALPGRIPGIGLSDHRNYWAEGFPALMVTDTAPFRYEHYHSGTDTPEKVDSGRLARVVEGLAEVIADLAGRE
jgi:Zn-dependent M28 family amino/carboxypeptidase